MRIVYVAGPYRGNGERSVWENIERAATVALEYWRLGNAVICPHKNTGMFGGAVPDHVWLDGDLEFLRCIAKHDDGTLMVLCPGWRTSSGTLAEKAEAERLGIPVIEWREGGIRAEA